VQVGTRSDREPPSLVARIPRSVAERAWVSYARRYGRDQSLDRICERGGFGAGELDMFAPGWREEVSELAILRRDRDQARADARVLAHAYEQDSRPPADVVKRALAYPVRPL
jgi:hypothetical protein